MELGERVWVGGDGLLQEPVEEHSAGRGVAPVEAEGVLVEVVGQVFEADVVVQGACDPAFEQRGDAVHAGQHFGDVVGLVAADEFVPVAHGRQLSEHEQPVGADQAAGLDHLPREVELLVAVRGFGNVEPDPAQALPPVAFDGDGDDHLVGGTAFFPADLPPT